LNNAVSAESIEASVNATPALPTAAFAVNCAYRLIRSLSIFSAIAITAGSM